jgi:UDP-N-acetylglucosamine transferase subunit ALG13
LTVGISFPFDRLVKAIDEANDNFPINERIFAQIGNSSYQPRSFEYVHYLKKSEFDNWTRKATHIIGHAGMGTILMALDNHKPLLVMPRLRKYSEVVNDHQVAIARKFEELGHILAAYKTDDLPEKIENLKSFVPRPRKSQAESVAERISRFLTQLNTIG